MDGPPPCETVCAAIHTLYYNPDPKEKEGASKWLESLQKSVYAWKVADELLHRKVNMESCFHGAQTMRVKIQKNFNELPPESHVSLRDSLLEHVQSVDDTTNVVIVTQLSLALADLALLMHSKWPSAVADLTTKLVAVGRTRALLEILTVLPEEVTSRHLRLGANRRDEITQDLRSSAHIVIQFLNACLTPQDKLTNERINQSKINVLKCFSAWVSLGVIKLQDIERQPVMIEAFNVLRDYDVTADLQVHEAATDCLCSLLVRMETSNELDDYNNSCTQLELNIFTAVSSLQDSYRKALAYEDNDRALSYCRIFTELGETMLLKIVNYPATNPTPHFAQGILDCVLMCCEHPDYDIPDITFPLWYRLSEELYLKNDNLLTSRFRGYIEQLINALCKHCQMEPDTEGVLEEAVEFNQFRLRVVELIKDVVFIVGSANVFSHMFEVLRNSQTSAGWESMEASLFIMCAVARNLVPSDTSEESLCVAQIVDAVLGLPESAHVAVRHTSLRLIGEFAEWIDYHATYLEGVLNWLLVGLQDKRLASEAATALQNICSHCQRHMAPHLQGLVHILGGIDNLSLKPAAATGLIKGVALVLSQLPNENIASIMKALCALQLGPITALIEQHGAAGLNNVSAKIVKNSVNDPVLFLDRLAAILRHVNPKVPSGATHPCSDVVINDIWPVVSRVCDTFISDARIIERMCRTIRFAVRCLGTESAPLLEPLVKQMVTQYQAYPHSCFLYLGSILVDEYAHLPVCITGLLEMLAAFLPPTFRLLVPQEETPPKSNGIIADTMRSHPDTVDDLFRLNTRFLQRAAVPYLRSPVFSSVMECALIAARLDHRDANTSVMKFLYELLHVPRGKENKDDYDQSWELVCKAREDFGAKIVDALVRAVVFSLPTYTFRDVADVLFELMLLERRSVCLWLQSTLEAISQPSTSSTTNGGDGMIVSPQVTKKQLVKFHKDVTSAEDPGVVSDAIREFSLLWR